MRLPIITNAPSLDKARLGAKHLTAMLDGDETDVQIKAMESKLSSKLQSEEHMTKGDADSTAKYVIEVHIRSGNED